MGLASKLAAAQGGSAPVANYASPSGGAYPGQQPYQAYPGAQSMAAKGPGYAPYPPSALQPGYPQPPPSSPYGAQGGYGQPGYARPPPPPPPGHPSSPYPPSSSPYPPSSSPYPPSSSPYPPSSSPYPDQSAPYSPYGSGAPYQQSPGPGSYGYGAPPPRPPPGQYGGPPPPSSVSSPQDAQAFQRQLEQAIRENHLERFAVTQRVPQIAARAGQQVDRLCQAWRINRELGNDIVRLALYDVVLYIDDSGSMSFEENGERIKDLQLILQRVAFTATLFDDDGIDVRFMNEDALPPHLLSGIRTEQQIEQLLANKRYKGLTPFGSELRKKVIDPILIPKLRSPGMQKPLLIIAITDGQPTDGQNVLTDAVRYAVGEAQRSPYGAGAVAFQFAQVGNDQKATEFLARLDNDPVVGREVDCTSNYENESAEMSKAQPPVDLTPDMWMMKLILGAIDPSYDTKDEKANMAPGGLPPRPPQGYGGPPGGGYGQPPPPGPYNQYGQGPPPPGQYGAPQGGYGAPGGGGYGRPPPGPPGPGGYPGGQPGGGYSQPPRY